MLSNDQVLGGQGAFETTDVKQASLFTACSV